MRAMGWDGPHLTRCPRALWDGGGHNWVGASKGSGMGVLHTWVGVGEGYRMW